MAAVTSSEKIWRRIALLTTIIAIFTIAIAAYNHSKRLEQQARTAASISGRSLLISAKSKEQLIALMKKEPLIIGVGAISISLKTNKRMDTFFQSENPALQKLWDDYIFTRTQLPVVFSQDPKFNSRITSIINGQFECRFTKDTRIATLYPAQIHAPVTCSISVPPGFDDSGDFVGYINFFMAEEVTDPEKARLAKLAVEISADIYKRDVAPAQTNTK